MKYDLAQAPRRRQERRPSCVLRSATSRRDVVIIGGSLHDREDEALLDAYAAARCASRRPLRS